MKTWTGDDSYTYDIDMHRQVLLLYNLLYATAITISVHLLNKLRANFQKCLSGKYQSPVNINAARPFNKYV